MTSLQFVVAMVLLMLVWLCVQVFLEVIRTKMLVMRQEEIVDKTASRIYDQIFRHGIKLIRDIKEANK